jgi:hypothetical protein
LRLVDLVSQSGVGVVVATLLSRGLRQLDEFGVGRVESGVGGCGDAGEAFEEGLGGGVEVLIGDAEDTTLLNGSQVMPVALVDDALEGDAIPCSAPGEEKNVGVGCGDLFGCGVGAGSAEVLASSGFD